MAMYECKNCGCEEGRFPGVMLAINPEPPIDDACERDFDTIFHNIHRNNAEEPDPTYRDRKALEKTWEMFYVWLGTNKLLWFCSPQCAIEYLEPKGEK